MPTVPDWNLTLIIPSSPSVGDCDEVKSYHVTIFNFQTQRIEQQADVVARLFKFSEK